jgi:cytochrome c
LEKADRGCGEVTERGERPPNRSSGISGQKPRQSTYLKDDQIMNKIATIFTACALSAACSLAFAEPPATEASAIDTSAAVKLAKSESCLRCHGVTKKKEGPPYAVIAAFYKSNKDAESVIFEHVTTGAKIKMSDGHKEYHKIIRDKTPEEIRNLVRWILSQ